MSRLGLVLAYFTIMLNLMATLGSHSTEVSNFHPSKFNIYQVFVTF